MKKFALLLFALSACKSGVATARIEGQTDYQSAPLPGTSRGALESSSGQVDNAAGAGKGTATPTAGSTGGGSTASPRTVQETDIYQIDGNRLYVLNTYRGLLIFDISNPDAPVLVGRSPSYGQPQEMIVKNGVASIVISDWFGALADGTPYNGSLVRSIDVTNAAQPKVLAEAQVNGFVSDVRVVGDVMYAVSLDYGYEYGYFGEGLAVGGVKAARDSTTVSSSGGSTTSTGPTVYVTSINIAAGAATQVAQKSFSGWSGAFHVTKNAVLLAQTSVTGAGTTLTYLDISDPAGAITQRGQVGITGSLDTWGADAGRWNIDLTDAGMAHAVTQSDGIIISTVDFTNPDAPVAAPAFTIPSSTFSYSVAARFDNGRLYIAPDSSYAGATSTVTIYDVSAPLPVFQSATQIQGDVWLFVPNGNELFALAGQYNSDNGEAISVAGFDVTDALHPAALGQPSFGSGWSWTPAASTFKAFVMNDAAKLIAIPFSGWSEGGYNNGVQLVSYAGNPLVAEGSAQVNGWVERGIFANGRLFAMSDLALAVIDYSTPTAPRVVTELTLARNITALQPLGGSIAELDEDWFGNDAHAELRILSAATPDDPTATVPSLKLDGSNARLFTNGSLTYVVTQVSAGQVACPANSGSGVANGGDVKGGSATTSGSASLCNATTQRIQVIDLSSGTPQKRGQVDLPASAGYYAYGWGYGAWDWYGGSDVVQVGNDALALRQWDWYSPSTPLYVVDLHDADHPSVASLQLANDNNQWWGNMVVVGSTLYATHDEWVSLPTAAYGYVRYYADAIDLSQRASPHVSAKINVPGVLIGGSATDANLLYTLDYVWDGQTSHSWLNAVRRQGSHAVYQGGVNLNGYSGRVVVSGTDVYTSVQDWQSGSMVLHDVSFADAKHPKDFSTKAKSGWGWLMDVQGDRAIIQSGWSGSGLDLYQLHAGSAPTFDQFVRTSGWWETAIARQGQALFFASGEYGVQTVTLPAR